MSRTVFSGAVAALAVMLLWVAPVTAQSLDEVVEQIREEGLERSRVMEHLHVLTDRFGHRLTGSPSLEAAGEWTLETMTGWGLVNPQKDEWDWGRPGWANHYFSGHLVSPSRDPLVGEVLAWTPGTGGPVRAEAVRIDLPADPTEEDLAAFEDSIRGITSGKIVLVGDGNPRSSSSALPRRYDDAELAERFRPGTSSAVPRPASRGRDVETLTSRLSAREVRTRFDAFLKDDGAAMVISPAGMDDGLIRAFANYSFNPEQALPSVVLRTEDYQRISRLLANGTTVELEFDIRNEVYPERTTEYNYTADIPGSDLAHEVVLIGGHIDSWHAATGATDNAAGVSVMMEAARILQTLGLEPRRTIRLAFWSGEEQGLYGSRAYVEKHFGTFEEPKPDFDNFAGYLNLDSGTGKIRGMTVFGPVEAAEVLHEIVRPFRDLGVVGARETASRRLGGSDHSAFNQAGLPGVSLSQDPIDYFTTTWHTSRDTFDQILEDDLRQAAVVVAAAAYALATRDDRLPRFSADEMPPAR
ncbi:MAG: M20/M25/M40 family metallo-hydrolase [Bacteroidota bacterium]